MFSLFVLIKDTSFFFNKFFLNNKCWNIEVDYDAELRTSLKFIRLLTSLSRDKTIHEIYQIENLDIFWSLYQYYKIVFRFILW